MQLTPGDNTTSKNFSTDCRCTRTNNTADVVNDFIASDCDPSKALAFFTIACEHTVTSDTMKWHRHDQPLRAMFMTMESSLVSSDFHGLIRWLASTFQQEDL